MFMFNATYPPACALGLAVVLMLGVIGLGYIIVDFIKGGF